MLQSLQARDKQAAALAEEEPYLFTMAMQYKASV